MSQYRQKEVEAIKASEAMSECNTCGAKMTGKYHIDCEHSCVGHLQRQLAEAREENEKLTNKNTLLAEGNSILMQQLKEKKK